MRLRAWAGGLCAVAAVALGTSVAAETNVSHVGAVEIIVSERDTPPAATSKRGKPAAYSVRAVAIPALGAADALVRTAMSLVGTPYRWGGASPLGFDCSGFTWYAFARIGISIPRTADVQFAAGRPVAGDPLPGDLVFFQTYDYGASHVGIYLGGGQFVNAIGSNVHVATFDSPYFRSRYIGARRFLPG